MTLPVPEGTSPIPDGSFGHETIVVILTSCYVSRDDIDDTCETNVALMGARWRMWYEMCYHPALASLGCRYARGDVGMSETSRVCAFCPP